MIRRLQQAALVLGLALFSYLLYEIGVDTIAHNLRTIGWGLAIVVLLEAALNLTNTAGWWFTFAPEERKASLSHLFLVRLAGTALNQTLPSATVGGEPLKVVLLQPDVSVAGATASVITAKICHSLAQAIFVVAGFAVGFHRIELPVVVFRGLLAALLLTVGGLGAFLWVQRRGLFAATASAAGTLRLPRRWVQRLRRGTATIDTRIRDFYSRRPKDFALSLGFHLAGFAFGVAQIYLLLRWLDLPADLVACVAIEAFSIMIQMALFLVPGAVGVQEGGKMLIFAALGLPSAAGLSVGIAFRLSQITEIAFGFAAFGFLQWRQRRAASRQPQAPVSG
jgi:putative membrane protein